MNNQPNSKISEEAEVLSQTAAEAVNSRSPEAFESLEQCANHFASMLREVQQADLRPRITAAIRHLESGRPLSPDERDAVRKLIVGDAERYLAFENNFDDWMNELQRLTNEIAQTAATADEEQLANLRGMIKDATRLVPTMRAYAEEKRRLEQFDRAFASLDGANRDILVQLLREMLDSPTR
jgi:chromosome segregation ATPase